MTPEQAAQAVTARAYVEARYLVGGVHLRGRVVAYSIVPVLTIETDDGERHTWRADMCEEAQR